MSNNNEDNESSNSSKDVIKEEIKKQPYWHLLSFFTTYIGSYLLPGIIFFVYLIILFIPHVLNTTNIINLFTEILPLISLLLMPIVIIGGYLIHLFFSGLITRYWWGVTEKDCPSKDGIIPRNIPSKTLNYYHIRSFMIKYPKNSVIKGPFPWLANWMFNFIGTNKIGKGTTIEEQACGAKFIEVGDNCYIGVNSILTSHLVEGIFGNIAYFKIKLGDNVTFSALNCIAPGTEINDNSYLLPLACTSKFNNLKGNNYYFGIPLRKIFTKKLQDFLKLTQEDFSKDEELRKKQQQLKNKRSMDAGEGDK